MTKPPRRKDEDLLTSWVMFRYAVVGLYVGVATVGAFVIWFTSTSFMGIDLSEDGHARGDAPAHALGSMRELERIQGWQIHGGRCHLRLHWEERVLSTSRLVR